MDGLVLVLNADSVGITREENRGTVPQTTSHRGDGVPSTEKLSRREVAQIVQTHLDTEAASQSRETVGHHLRVWRQTAVHLGREDVGTVYQGSPKEAGSLLEMRPEASQG
jgi:hypothetical protein